MAVRLVELHVNRIMEPNMYNDTEIILYSQILKHSSDEQYRGKVQLRNVKK